MKERYYYTDGKNYYSYKQEHLDLTEISEEEFNNHTATISIQTTDTHKLELKWEISTLKQQLAATDYKAIKYFEGYYTDEEYAPIKAERQNYRDQINELESQL